MILFYLLIVVMPLVRHPIWSQLAGELTITKYLGTVCLAYAFVYLISRRTPIRLFQTWQARWFVFLALAGMASFLTRGVPYPWWISPFMSYLSFLMLFFTTVVVVDSLSRLRYVLLTAIGSMGLASLYVLREWQKNLGTYAEVRPGWVTGDPNYFTISALLCLPLAFYLTQEQRPRWEKAFCLGCLVLTLLAIFVAASRGGFLGLVAALLFVVWRSGQRMRNLLGVSALLLMLSLAIPGSPLQRFLNPAKGDLEAQEVRLVMWKGGLRMVWENPLTGIGLGNFRAMSWPYGERYAPPERTWKVAYNVAHNTFIEIAAELGFPGLLAFLAIFFGTFRTLEQVRRGALRSGPVLLHQTALGIQGGLVGYAVAAFFVSAQYQKLFWLMVFLSMCLPSLTADAHQGQRELLDRRAAVSFWKWGEGVTTSMHSR